MPDDHIVNFRRVIDRQLVAKDGDLMLPQTPGLGWNFDGDAVRKYGARYPGSEDIWQVVR
jgi:L-alanine-DL-glutamate epimerase-like enolase superfamily enzyme